MRWFRDARTTASTLIPVTVDGCFTGAIVNFYSFTSLIVIRVVLNLSRLICLRFVTHNRRAEVNKESQNPHCLCLRLREFPDNFSLSEPAPSIFHNVIFSSSSCVVMSPFIHSLLFSPPPPSTSLLLPSRLFRTMRMSVDVNSAFPPTLHILYKYFQSKS